MSLLQKTENPHRPQLTYCLFCFRFSPKSRFILDSVGKWSTRRGFVRNINTSIFVTAHETQFLTGHSYPQCSVE
jgi:hypothetical protein